MKTQFQKLVPASLQQEGIWFHALAHGSSFWNTVDVKVYAGTVNVIALKRALQIIIERHSVLRTNYMLQDDTLLQLIRTEINLEDFFSQEENKEESFKEIQKNVEAEIRKAEHYNFDYEKDVLVKLKLFHFTDQVVMMLTMNHINHDVISLGLFWEELAQEYNICIANQQSSLLLPKQYFEYAFEQRKHMRNDEYIEEKNQELKKLVNGIPALDLNFCQSNAKGCTHKISLPLDLLEEIRTFSLRNRVILSSIFQLGYFLLLHSYSKANRILVANIVGGRGIGKNENGGVMGLFANVLINDLEIENHHTAHDLLQKVNEGLIQSIKRNIPFEDLIRESHAQNRHGLSEIRAAFNVIKTRDENRQLFHGLERQKLQFEHTRSSSEQYDIYLFVEDQEISLFLKCEAYQSSLVETMLLKYIDILRRFIANPEATSAEIVSVTLFEQSLLTKFNLTERTHADSVFSLYDRQVASSGNDSALVFGDRSLTYGELDRKVNQISLFLVDKYHVGAGVRVGVFLERSIESVICMLGILKCGGCYVPIDTEIPESRINHIMEVAGPAVILSERELMRAFEASHRKFEIVSSIFQNDVNRPFSIKHAQPEDDVYILFTSGSTGLPKGVVQSYRMLYNLILWQMEAGPVEKNMKHLLHAPFSFDMVIHHLLYGLLSGHEMFLVDAETRKDVLALQAYILENKIEFVPLVFSVHNAMFSETDPLSWQSHKIKYMLSTGEQLCMVPSITSFLKNNPRIQFYNHYGPTESHVVTETNFNANDPLSLYPSIGKPISNTQIFILDEQESVVPLAVVGEIFIGGSNLAQCYLKDDALTNSKFKVISVDGKQHRVYKTGDVGYWMPDGTINYLGRNDDQVKIRGFRVELGEIESVLLQSEKISNCVVTLSEDGKGNKRLVAYLASGSDLNKEHIRNDLFSKLPSYMVPGVLVIVDSLPLTINGKVDKKNLPVPDFSTSSSNQYVPPKTKTETRLIEILSELLGVDRIGIYDDFFELGGHSLLATRVVSAIRKEFTISLPIKYLFEFKLVHEIARSIDLMSNSFESKESEYEVVDI